MEDTSPLPATIQNWSQDTHVACRSRSSEQIVFLFRPRAFNLFLRVNEELITSQNWIRLIQPPCVCGIVYECSRATVCLHVHWLTEEVSNCRRRPRGLGSRDSHCCDFSGGGLGSAACGCGRPSSHWTQTGLLLWQSPHDSWQDGGTHVVSILGSISGRFVSVMFAWRWN